MTDYNTLIKTLREKKDNAAMLEVWRHLFGLPNWFSIGSPNQPDAPLAVRGNGEVCTHFFTTEELAKDFANQNGWNRPDGAAPIIACAPQQAVQWIKGVAASGMQVVWFNPGEYAFGLPPQDIVAFAAQFGLVEAGADTPQPVRLPMPDSSGDEKLDELVETFRREPNRENDIALFGHVFSFEKWHFINRGSWPDEVRPFCGVVDGQPMIMAFTHEHIATAFASAQQLTVGEQGHAILSMTLKDAVQTAVNMGRHGAPAIQFNPVVHGVCVPTSSLPGMYAYFKKEPLE